MDLDELIRVAANHPLLVMTLGSIIVLILMKSFNQLN